MDIMDLVTMRDGGMEGAQFFKYSTIVAHGDNAFLITPVGQHILYILKKTIWPAGSPCKITNGGFIHVNEKYTQTAQDIFNYTGIGSSITTELQDHLDKWNEISDTIMFVWLWSILKTYNQGTNNLPYNPQIPTGNSVSYGENAYLSYQDNTVAGLDDGRIENYVFIL